MLWRHDGTAEALRSPVPWLVLSGCLTLVAFGWNGLDRGRRVEANHQFAARSDAVLSTVRSRMAAHEQLARASAAFLAASPAATRADWREYVGQLRLPERHPGIQSLGWGARIVNGDGRESVVVAWNEPFAGRNMRSLGSDLYAEPAYHAAMDNAAERMDAVLSGAVPLAGNAGRGPDADQPVQLLFVPVARTPAAAVKGVDRGEVAGFVFMTLRVRDLVHGALDESTLETLDFTVHDGVERRPEALLADTRQVFRGQVAGGPAAFEREARLQLPGRVWTVSFASRPAFEATMGNGRPWVVVAAGGIASLVVFLLTLAVMAAWIRTHQMSMRDPLTGLFNRRYVEETIGRELTRAKRRGESIGVVVLDLDHFKALNDTHGHNAGDKVLVRIGELLRENTRGSDIPCRFGGEEFAVILPGATLETATHRAERIREAFARMQIAFGGAQLGPCTLSAGVSALKPKDTDWAYVLLQADRALYAAKQAGRNRVVAATE